MREVTKEQLELLLSKNPGSVGFFHELYGHKEITINDQVVAKIVYTQVPNPGTRDMDWKESQYFTNLV